MEKLNLPRFDRPLEVLVVDDDLANLAMVRKILEPCGVIVRTEPSGEKALQSIAGRLPDVVLLDVVMPGLTGYEVCKKIKDDETTRLVPVVIVTALAEKQDRLLGIEVGCDDFLIKPFDRAELIARVHALGKAKRANDELELAESVVLTLARAVEAKDPTTGDHCDRLVRLTGIFARHLSLDLHTQRILARASVLHDVGKIGVPDHILLKPGKLTLSEWEVMRCHPAKGEEICRPLRSLAEVNPIIRHHHERWNGSGYPDGLAGEAIPYLARVFQIVDAFDAMTTRRPYKPACEVEESLRLLKAETEKGLWDPALMKSFLECIERLDQQDPASTWCSVLRGADHAMYR